MKLVLIGNREYHNEFKKENNEFVVAVDGGYDYLKNQNIIPNLIIGDMDSLTKEITNIETIKYPKIKDKTDMHLAIEYALETGFDDIYIYGALGKRIEHSIANLNLLYLFKDKNIKIIDQDLECFVLNKGHHFFNKQQGYISIFSLTPSSTISINGLKYELNKKEITNSFPLGIDNEALNLPFNINIHKGTLLIMTRFIK